MLSNFKISALLFVTFVSSALAHNHQITVINNCGGRTRVTLPGTGEYGAGTYGVQGDVRGGLATICAAANGSGCTSVKFDLLSGDLSKAAIDLIPPHHFNYPVQFRLDNNPNDSTSASCQTPDCNLHSALRENNDMQAYRSVDNKDSSLWIKFC